ncbi:MAG: tetratricopeptide repeat protein [Balneolales bacterium]|nr:tetratricopeptide repeat protein [Balneolales bacterium]
MRYKLLLLFLGIFSATALGQSLDPGVELFEKGEQDQAHSFFQEYIKDNPDEPEAYFYIGRIYFDKEDYGEAVKWIEKAVDRKEGDSKYHMWLGHGFGRRAQNASVLKQANLAKNSRKNYEKAIELDPTNIEARESAMEYYLQAPGFLGGGRDKAEKQALKLEELDVDAGIRAWGRVYTYYDEVDLAEFHYETAIQNHPGSMVAYYSLFAFYFNEQRYEEAITIGRQQLEINDTTATIYYNLGNALSRNDQFDEALNQYQISLELDSTFYNNWYQIGRLAALSGNHLEMGKGYLEQYIALDEMLSDNTLAWAYYRLGSIEQHLEKEEEAKKAYQKALEFDKDHEQAKTALANLN